MLSENLQPVGVNEGVEQRRIIFVRHQRLLRDQLVLLPVGQVDVIVEGEFHHVDFVPLHRTTVEGEKQIAQSDTFRQNALTFLSLHVKNEVHVFEGAVRRRVRRRGRRRRAGRRGLLHCCRRIAAVRLGRRGAGRRRFVMFGEHRQRAVRFAVQLADQVRPGGQIFRTRDLPSVVSVCGGVRRRFDQISFVLQEIRRRPDVRLQVIEAEEFLDQLPDVHRDRTVLNQPLVERIALEETLFARVELWIERVISRVDQTLDEFLFEHDFAENVLQVTGQRSVLFEPFFGQFGQVRGDQRHVLLIRRTLKGQVAQQTDQLRQQRRGGRMEGERGVLDEQIEQFHPDRRGDRRLSEPELHVGELADADQIAERGVDDRRVLRDRCQLSVQLFDGAKETRVGQQFIEETNAERRTLQPVEIGVERVDLLEHFHRQMRLMVADGRQQPVVFLHQPSSEVFVEMRRVASPDEMNENLFQGVVVDRACLSFDQHVEQRPKSCDGKVQFAENLHVVLLENVFDQPWKLLVRTRIADEEENLVANEIFRRASVRLQSSKELLQKIVVDLRCGFQDEVDQLQVMVERAMLIGEEHRDLMAVVHGDRRGRRRRGGTFHRRIHDFRFVVFERRDERVGRVLVQTELLAVDGGDERLVRLRGLIDQHLLVVGAVAKDGDLLQTDRVVIDRFVEMNLQLANDVDLFRQGQVDDLLALRVQEETARKKIESVRGDFAGDRRRALAQVRIEMVDDGVMIDRQLGEGDQLNRLENDRVGKLQNQRAPLFVRAEGVGPGRRTEATRRRRKRRLQIILGRLDQNVRRLGVRIRTTDLALRGKIDRADLHVRVRRLALVVDALDRADLTGRRRQSRGQTNEISDQEIDEFRLIRCVLLLNGVDDEEQQRRREKRMVLQVMAENGQEERRSVNERRETIINAVAHREKIAEGQTNGRVREGRTFSGRLNRGDQESHRRVERRRGRGVGSGMARRENGEKFLDVNRFELMEILFVGVVVVQLDERGVLLLFATFETFALLIDARRVRADQLRNQQNHLSNANVAKIRLTTNRRRRRRRRGFRHRTAVEIRRR